MGRRNERRQIGWGRAAAAVAVLAGLPAMTIGTALAQSERKAPPSGSAPLIRVDEGVEGQLEPSDPTLADGTHYDCYYVAGRPGQLVTISMRSIEFDTYLLAAPGDPEGCDDLLAEFQDDDSGGGTDSQLTVNLDEGGGMLIFANSFAPDSYGTYTVVVEPGGPSVLALAF